jgi:von Willebrand factor type D domain
MKSLNIISISLLSINVAHVSAESNLISLLLSRRKGKKVSAGSGGGKHVVTELQAYLMFNPGPKQFQLFVCDMLLSDPHFRTYDGTTYSFHGQCDLVMARSNSFGSGLGLDLHARTEMIENWSLISNAAIRIGNDILEVANDGSVFFNGANDVEFPLMLAGQYKSTKEIELIEGVHDDGSFPVNHTRSYIVIDLGNDDDIWITTYKNMVSVEINAYLEDSEGMLGIHSKAGMIGRDRETAVSSANDMGLQWQVHDDERMLFKNEKFPQFPEECVLPSTQSRRRLRQTTKQLQAAASACEKVGDNMRQFCIDDVLLTGDTDVAGVYSLGF